ncbi:sensor histidine kinase [Mucilaginibacter sp. SP1R1]|uniref:sensor histidine kinase n=1 Tax=Mucilaginibacter sp. SP1R1 TaxID=2723091 RepID=UPI0017D9DDF8|nr:histidine kinase [Mucilaginibacter sp. SP1R1]MBB6148032.1 heme/copper-type cytochrome/quinol oxidase subunit 4 [Mucilaginibacter sp. SP1R1]
MNKTTDFLAAVQLYYFPDMLLYLYVMGRNLPAKNLFWLTLLLSVVVSMVICIYLYQNKNEVHQLINTLLTFIVITIIGLSHLGILILLNGKLKLSRTRLKLSRYLLTYIAGILAYFIIWPFFAPYSNPNPQLFDRDMVITFICSGVVVNTMFIVAFDLVLLQHDKSKADLEFSRLKATHAEAANLFLKQQIHPHFLFNALNTLNALYRKDLNAGETYIVHLANFLRASIENHDQKISSLDKELALLNDYLEMQKIRFGTALDCRIDVPDEPLNKYYLPSFSLQPLLENAIKHNDLTTQAPLIVQIFCQGDRIVVHNNLKKKIIKPQSTRHGLANLAERYRLWSGDEVIIKEDKETFTVSIKLLSDEHSDH